MNDMRELWVPIEEIMGDRHTRHSVGPVMLCAPELVNEDFNPDGVSVGHWADGGTEGDLEDGSWVAADWCSSHDHWVMRDVTPTHFMRAVGPTVVRYDAEFPTYGRVMTKEEFGNSVECGGFIDYDGSGYPARNGMMSDDVDILPSQWPDCMPDDATHVVWFNR